MIDDIKNINVINSEIDNNKINNEYDEINSMLNSIFDILSEDIIIDGVGFKTSDIEELKKEINDLSK